MSWRAMSPNRNSWRRCSALRFSIRFGPAARRARKRPAHRFYALLACPRTTTTLAHKKNGRIQPLRGGSERLRSGRCPPYKVAGQLKLNRDEEGISTAIHKQKNWTLFGRISYCLPEFVYTGNRFVVDLFDHVAALQPCL